MIPETITLSVELRVELELFVRRLAGGVGMEVGEDWRAVVDEPKLRIAEQLLRDLGLPTHPAPFETLAPDDPRRRRRPTISTELRWRIFKRDNYRCVGCGSDTALSVDHRVPVALEGTDDEDNLQTLCRTCNSGKGARA